MVDINEKVIRNISTAEAFQRGLKYYLNNHVDYMDIKTTEDTGVKRTFIAATVKSEADFFKKYDVRINFDNYSN